MFRPGRILLILLLAFAVYGGFYATPPGPIIEGQFSPDDVATQELASWKAVKGHDDLSLYISNVLMLREQYRYSWFRAAQAGFYLSRATTTFVELHSRYERVLPDLEAAAAIEKDWMHASFDPAAVARAELDWWVTRNMPNLNSIDAVAQLMSKEYGLRYQTGADRMMDAATLRTQAAADRDDGGIDPDWTSISKKLAESYRALRTAIAQERARRAR